jgi:hypothetical protein
VTHGKLERRSGRIAFVTLQQISRVGALPRVKRHVGITCEPGRFRQQRQVFWKERILSVSDAKRLKCFVPGVTAVRVATLLNGIFDELTHRAPVDA